MASIIHENGKFRAYVYVKGVRQTETFSTEKRAKNWAQENVGFLCL